MAELELMFLNLEFVLRVTDRLPSFYWQLDVFAVSAVAVEPNEREDEKRFSSLVELPPVTYRQHRLFRSDRKQPSNTNAIVICVSC